MLDGAEECQFSGPIDVLAPYSPIVSQSTRTRPDFSG
jgi:hypothetical protein